MKYYRWTVEFNDNVHRFYYRTQYGHEEILRDNGCWVSAHGIMPDRSQEGFKEITYEELFIEVL
jgi:hypothetical protein